MLEFVLEQEPRGAIARVGKLRDQSRGREYLTPASAPVLATTTEATATLRLFQDGVRTPVIFVPLSRRGAMKSQLGSLMDRSVGTLDGFVGPTERPMILPDPEAEALSSPSRARDLFLNDKLSPPPDQARALLDAVLRQETKGKMRSEYGKIWDQTLSTVGIANVGEWFERMTHEAGSSAYLAPSPVIRGSQRSVRRAFQIVWRFVDTAATSFDASGPHFVLHEEVFRDERDCGTGSFRISRKPSAAGSPRSHHASYPTFP